MPTFPNPNKWSIAALGVFLAIMGRGTAQAIVFTNEQALANGQLAPGEYSGVVSLNYLGQQFCTGSLLPGGLHILTAAHCLTEEGSSTFNSILTKGTEVSFNLSAGRVSRAVEDFFIFPDYKDLEKGDDVAVLKLAEAAPDEAEQYDIYRDRDEIGRTFTKVGYGNIGTGDKGQIDPSNPSSSSPNSPSLGYVGQNRFEALGEDADPNSIPGSQLLYDFDNDTNANNVVFSNRLSDLGLGDKEVNTADGDSGGPAFIGNLVAGITSYGARFSDPPLFDIDSELNASFGEFSGDVRVSFYADFIDAAVAGEVPSATSVPEPSLTLGTFALGAWGASRLLKRGKKQKSA
jgi:secreted trypsin-like serine protease